MSSLLEAETNLDRMREYVLFSTNLGMPKKIPMLASPMRIMGFLRMVKMETVTAGYCQRTRVANCFDFLPISTGTGGNLHFPLSWKKTFLPRQRTANEGPDEEDAAAPPALITSSPLLAHSLPRCVSQTRTAGRWAGVSGSSPSKRRGANP